MSLKEAARHRIPTPVIRFLQRIRADYTLRQAYCYDRRRFLRFSSSVDPRISRQNLASRITESYHNIEKGLSLPEPRPAFGRLAIERLLEYLNDYVGRYDDDFVSRAAVSTLAAYLDFSRGCGVPDRDIPRADDIIAAVNSLEHASQRGGARPIDRADILATVAPVGEEFFMTRSSVRQFLAKPVDHEDIRSAVRVAQKSPAVCNRQFAKVYVMSRSDDIARALHIQAGARGFAENVPALAVITTNVRNFWSAGERMQPWTDGGMFAMSFILGLHARGLGSVCLNWSKIPETDRAFHTEFGIPDEEVIVMLVAFGYLKEDYKVAVSPRIPVEESLFHI